MRVPKTDARDYLLDHFKQIVLCPFAHLPGRQGRGRVGYKEDAEAFLHPCRCDCVIDAVGDIDRFFRPLGFDPQETSHSKHTGER
jgi:hypothetical protein